MTRRLFVGLWLAACVAACGQPEGPIAITLTPPTGSTPAFLHVSGLSSRDISGLAAWTPDDPRWAALLTVRVSNSPGDAPAVMGQYAASSSGVEFTPRFPFDPGRTYRATFDPARLPEPRSGGAITADVGLPAPDRAPPTVVRRILPTAGELPENLLRIYIEFSAPMSRGPSRGHVRLLDAQGREMPDTFLAVDVELWNVDYTRCTVFFDPGRVKRGILPNETMGRALRVGQQYTIAVDGAWRDANGQALASPFRRTFRVRAAEMAPLTLASWTVAAPRAGSRDAVVVTFPKPLDHGLLMRALGVASATEDPLPGNVEVGANEKTWTFTPRDPWKSGAYNLTVLGVLEDPQGNRLGRPFDVDRFDQIDKTAEPDRHLRPFTVR